MRESERARALQGNPGLLSGLTPTQIAELFPDYFKRGTPDVGGFYAAISKESAKKQQTWQGSVDSRLDQQGGMLSRMRKEYAGEGGEGKIRNMVKAQEVYNYLRAKGVDHIHAVGMLNNIEHESGFNAASKHYDVNGPSAGLFQHHDVDGKGGRFSQLKAFTNGDWSDWRKQVDFALQEGVTKRYLAQKFNSAEDASVYFTHNFENPANKEQVAADRLKTIKTFDKFTQTGETTPQGAQGDQRKGQTPQQQAGAPTTPGAPAGDTTSQAGKVVEGTKFNVVSGYIVPQDKSLYDPRNASQCATLGKAFNPAVGRSSGWSIVDGDIKAGQVVATKQYNNPGADRVGAGYHTGVALTAPNEKGDFLLLEQYNGSGGAKTRWVNKNSYPIGHTGQTTSWGLISSGGKVHDEISQEALAYGEKLGGPNKAAVGTNSGTPGQGGETAPGVEGQVEYAGETGQIGGTTVGEGEQQSASLMQPVAMMQNLMGMMGGMGGATAIPLGLITTAMGFIMPLIGSIAGERLTGEGMGGPGASKLPHINVNRATMGHRGHRGHRGSRSSTQTTQTTAKTTTQSVPAQPVDNTPISHRADIGHMSVKYESGGRGVESISSGRKDPGGVSYGEHQLASKTGTMGKYLRSAESKGYSEKFAGLKPGSAEFNKVYRQIAKEDPKGFAKSQQDYITRTHYEPVYRHAKALGYNVNDPRVQEALYSISVQHGGAKKVVSMAKSSVDADPQKQVESLFGARRQYVASKGMNFDTRYKSEKREILAMDVTKYKQDEMPTQFAGARPETTTAQVGPGATTPAAAPMMPTQMASQQKEEKGLFQQAKEFAGIGSTQPVAQPSVGTTGTPTTPAAQPSVTTPTYVAPGTPSVSTSISNAAAPAAPISKAARTPFGIYANPSKTDIMNQFGYRKELSATPVTSTSNVPAAPATPPTVLAPTKGAMMQAPGPAPDTTAMQMRTQMQTVAMAQAGEAQRPMPQMQQVSQVSHVLNHDQTMKMIQNPADNPSVYRAFARTATGEELPGALGHGHFSNGNSVA